MPVPEGDVQDEGDDADRDGDGDGTLDEAHAHDDGRQHRQVERHREVLDDEDGEDRRGLPVREAAEVPEQLRDDPRRGDPGDPGEGDGGDRTPPQQQRERRTGQGVEEAVDDARHSRRPEAADEFRRRVLEAEQREEQDDADLGAGLEELGTGIEWDEPTLTEGEPEQEVERDRRDPDTEREAPEQAHSEKQRADFDEEQRGLVHASPLSRGRWRGASLLRRVLHEFRRRRRRRPRAAALPAWGRE